jgi:hypothetical protein
MNNLAKKPQKGGTPAIENREILIILVKKWVAPKFKNEKRVFASAFLNW